MQLGRLVLRRVYGGAGGVEDGEIVVLRIIEHRESPRALLFVRPQLVALGLSRYSFLLFLV